MEGWRRRQIHKNRINEMASAYLYSPARSFDYFYCYEIPSRYPWDGKECTAVANFFQKLKILTNYFVDILFGRSGFVAHVTKW